MKLSKTIFARGLTVWLTLVTLYALIQLVRGMEPLLSWLGLALTALPLLIFFLRSMLGSKAVSSDHRLGFSVVAALGLAITMAMSYRYAQAAGIVHVWSGVTLSAWLTYLRWNSIFRSIT